jgi:hypothetical protein
MTKHALETRPDSLTREYSPLADLLTKPYRGRDSFVVHSPQNRLQPPYQNRMQVVNWVWDKWGYCLPVDADIEIGTLFNRSFVPTSGRRVYVACIFQEPQFETPDDICVFVKCGDFDTGALRDFYAKNWRRVAIVGSNLH